MATHRLTSQIAISCRGLLHDLQETDDTQYERLWGVQRSSHQIMRQIQDLASFAHAPDHQSRPVSHLPPVAQSPRNTRHGVPVPDNIVARLEQNNPQAAEQAAKDMAAIRARTHGNVQKPFVDDRRKERERR